MAAIVNPSGRVIHYARATGKTTVLLDNLWFANGIVLSPEEDFLVVCDLFGSKLTKFWLKQGMVGETQTFADGLPGAPDNLSADKNGIWVGLPFTADPQAPFLHQSLARLPLARKFAVRCLSLLELFFNAITNIYPNDLTKSIAYQIGITDAMKMLLSKRATILRVDWNGNIIAAYHSFDGAVYTHVLELDGNLYLGSIAHNYIAKVPRKGHL